MDQPQNRPSMDRRRQNPGSLPVYRPGQNASQQAPAQANAYAFNNQPRLQGAQAYAMPMQVANQSQGYRQAQYQWLPPNIEA
jgi:hypothetical protein